MSDVVERAKAALEGAYEGPWVQVGGGNINVDPVGHRPPVAKAWTRGNGEFIAQARTLVPELVAEVERLRAQETRIRALCESLERLARKYEENHLANHGRGVLHARRELLAALDTEGER
ncbi:hypothetical protein AVANI_91 [Mycobacterium phage Avani]|uniref:Uncharacterized protein n=2 Tax=Gracegardnervirinae TaxID=2946632 RepID=I3WWW7_9CAUD|nr:hypothetical protein CL78_gp091 [Mycobacterium phage Avani]YP_009124285.1 hypothetical protein PBI_ESTAVE1_94 [Mycobacterium phage Estave1]AFL47995.1 hypothetical protein AVANI_91 [Mycobacterium phage Avani]AIM40484.1 hypothetical protein PBI_ESTAVE1_94 [Mycobacterium phage Estave1]WAA20394.1 hypothetical protein SEA_VREDHORSE_87 [Mycobacterium phage VRedHorse]